MQTAADGAVNAVAEEPPSKNVRVARRGVAAGLSSLALYLILATYAAMSGWEHNEQVAFARATLTVAMVAGLGVALFGYGIERSMRNCAASNAEQLERFRNVLAEAEVGRLRRERWTADRLEEIAEQLERDRTLLRLRPKDPQRTVAKVPRQRRRGGRGRQVPTNGEPVADNVRYLRSVPGGEDALRRIAKRLANPQDE